MLQEAIRRVERIGERPGDDSEVRSQKRVLVVISVTVGVLSIGWGAIYAANGELLAASIPWAYTISVFVSLAIFAGTKRFDLFRTAELILILLLPFLLQLALGGFVNASAVIIWSLLAPLGALAMGGRRQAIGWFVAYAGLVVVAQWLQPSLGIENNLPTSVIAGFFMANIVAATGVSFFALHYFVGQKDEALEMLGEEQAKSERLLLNVLPREIASILKESNHVIAERYPEMSVLFADVVGFTPLSERLEADEVVTLLNDVFSYFDSLVEDLGLEKIRTMGDAYMVASGVPTSRPDHAIALAHMALAMYEYRPSVSGLTDSLAFRIGMSSGPAVAGVIGRAKFQYDVWGDTVNTASRMESHGVPGRIQVSPSSHRLLENDFVLEPRGAVDIKGKGPTDTWFLISAL